MTRFFKKHGASYMFVLPSFLLFAVFSWIPLVWTFVLSLEKGDVLSSRTFVGLNNFLHIAQDELFWQVLKNTAYFTVLVLPGVVVVGLTLAMLVNQGLRGSQMFTTLFFVPLLASIVVASVIWKKLLGPLPTAPVNSVLGLIGIPPQAWLSNPSTSIPAVVMVEIWRGVGFYVVVFLSALRAIPNSLYEAARIDGGSSGRIFLAVTLPLLKPTLLFTLVMATIWNFQLFDSVFVLTNGGPANATATAVWYIYKNAFHFGQVGYASAMGLFLLAVILIASLIQMKWLRSDFEY